MVPGTTYLTVKDRGGVVVVKFGKRNAGAPDWPWLTDYFMQSIDSLDEFDIDPGEVKKLDGDKTLGRGARLRMLRAHLFVVLGVWQEDAKVVAALDNGTLTVEGAVPKNWRKLSVESRDRQARQLIEQ